MALFHMQRYVCDEETSNNKRRAESSQNILTQLHDKALARKRKLESEVISDGQHQETVGKKHAKGQAGETRTLIPIKSDTCKQQTGKTSKKKHRDRKLSSTAILKRLTAKARAREKALLLESTETTDSISVPLHSESPKITKAKKLQSEPQEAQEALHHSKTSSAFSFKEASSDVKILSSKGKKKRDRGILKDEIVENTTPNSSSLSRVEEEIPRTAIHSPNRSIDKQFSKAAGKVELEVTKSVKKHNKVKTASDSASDKQNNRHNDTEPHLKSTRKKKDKKKTKGSQSKPKQIVQQGTDKSETGLDKISKKRRSSSSDDVRDEKRTRLSPESEGTMENFERVSLDSHKKAGDSTGNGNAYLRSHGNSISNLTSDKTVVTSAYNGSSHSSCNGSLSDNVGETSKDADAERLKKQQDNAKLEEGQRLIVDGDDDVSIQPRGTAEDPKEKMFAVLGGEKIKKKEKVSRVLPEWLANPTLIEHDLKKHSVSVEEMDQLDPRLVKGLQRDGISSLFPVQRHVIPAVLESVQLGIHAGEAGYRPRDLCVSAPTGSGKTLAFALPIVQALLDRVVPHIRALIVLPTRDLAQQVFKVFTSLCDGNDLRPALVGGLKKFTQEQRMLVQTSNGETHCDIVVATPGRLVDHINKTRGFTLQHLRFLVIDEADRMMDKISQDWIAQVEKCVFTENRPAPGPVTVANCAPLNMPLQKLLFSATLSQNPEKLTQLNLFRPRLMTSVVASMKTNKQNDQGPQKDRGEFIGKYTTPIGLSEYYIPCSPGEKPLVVLHLIRSLQLRQILCFANTVQATHRLYHLIRLVGGVEVAEFSSNQVAGQRRQILQQFKSGKIQLLVCSDAMARGMDVQNAKYVLSYDMPPYVKTYIHRVGRTARAGKSGVAFSLLQKHEVPRLLKMLKNAGKSDIKRHPTKTEELEYLYEAYEKALQKLPGILKKEKSYS